MYRVAICDDEPHAAEQNEAMLCQILEDRGLKRDIDYSVHCFSICAFACTDGKTAIRFSPAPAGH